MEICLKNCWLHLRFCCKVALFNSTNSRRKRKIIGRISQADSKFLTAKCFCKKYKLQGLRRLEIEISVTQRLGFFKSNYQLYPRSPQRRVNAHLAVCLWNNSNCVYPHSSTKVTSPKPAIATNCCLPKKFWLDFFTKQKQRLPLIL